MYMLFTLKYTLSVKIYLFESVIMSIHVCLVFIHVSMYMYVDMMSGLNLIEYLEKLQVRVKTTEHLTAR